VKQTTEAPLSHRGIGALFFYRLTIIAQRVMKSTARWQDQREKCIMDERTLTERIERVEQLLSLSGFGGEEFTGTAGEDKYRATQDVVNRRLSERIERPTDQTQKCTSLEEIVNRIQGSTERVYIMTRKLREIGDRVLGAEAEETGGGAELSKPDGTLEHVFFVLNILDQALARLHEQSARVERI
jgi:hypothetical protein